MSYDMEKRRSCQSCLKYLLVVVNCFLLIIALAISAVFLWMAIDQVDPVEAMTGNNLLMVSVGLLIAGGLLLTLTTCLGIGAASAENFGLMISYSIIIFVIFLFFAASAICVSVFKTMLTEPMRMSMEESLKSEYGVYLEDDWHRRVTNAWDKAQIRWNCCSAGDKSWALYQESKWFKLNIATYGRPYIPESCCDRNLNGQVKDRQACLLTKPPSIGDQYSGIPAPVHQRGCYETLRDFFLPNELSWFTGILWVSICGAILMFLVFIFSIIYTVQIRRDTKPEYYNRTQELEFLSKSSASSQFIVNNTDQSLSIRQTAPNQYMYSMA